MPEVLPTLPNAVIHCLAGPQTCFSDLGMALWKGGYSALPSHSNQSDVQYTWPIRRSFVFGTFAAYLSYHQDEAEIGKAQIYPTDFQPVRGEIELERRVFTGTALFDEDGKAYFKPQALSLRDRRGVE
ncbi:hypothetical protein AC579_212 [Pseudocercospora musae]|uniref:Uncharacterized protein n=2 Tax=Pseudocercospora musae TaxID=113226 RepID=A0A139I7N6_9PEZI|nr:hypothetical protein AC579_212 [Pseudocercospora musae]KXT10707.1 hypothetical protein AC579_212 [Pseudocercospora musae]